MPADAAPNQVTNKRRATTRGGDKTSIPASKKGIHVGGITPGGPAVRKKGKGRPLEENSNKRRGTRVKGCRKEMSSARDDRETEWSTPGENSKGNGKAKAKGKVKGKDKDKDKKKRRRAAKALEKTRRRALEAMWSSEEDGEVEGFADLSDDDEVGFAVLHSDGVGWGGDALLMSFVFA